jgi:hypothetical protein
MELTAGQLKLQCEASTAWAPRMIEVMKVRNKLPRGGRGCEGIEAIPLDQKEIGRKAASEKRSDDDRAH